MDAPDEYAPKISSVLSVDADTETLCMIRLRDGRVVHATKNHSWHCTDGRWRRSDELTPGMLVEA